MKLERTEYHSEGIFSENKHLTLCLFWWAAKKVSYPAEVLVVATTAARHHIIFNCASHSLCFLLQMNRQKTSQEGRGTLLPQNLDFSLSASGKAEDPNSNNELLQTKNIYNLSKLSSGRAIQTVSSTS